MPDSAGLHIIMDARVADASVFSQAHLTSLFAKIVTSLGMTALGDPVVYEVDVDPAVLERVKATGKFEDEGGISGIQVISTSHLTLHAWPLQSYFALDAFSCKDFDAEVALNIIREAMGVTDENTLVVARRKPSVAGSGRSVQYFTV